MATRLETATDERLPRAEHAVAAGPAKFAMAIWQSLPDWTFRAIGAAFFLGFLLLRLPDYFVNFWGLGPHYQFANGYRLALPWTRVLVDLTCLLMGMSYVFRLPARQRVQRIGDVAVALLGGFWPMFPLVLMSLLAWTNADLARRFGVWLWRDPLSPFQFLAGAGLVVAGNALDVWGYGTLFRSFSIVPEARELKVTGAYRIVRHPIYLGQMMAQAGVWLFFASFNIVSVAMLCGFIAIQLVRSRLEDRVLEAAFGESHRQWRRRTFWFV